MKSAMRKFVKIDVREVSIYAAVDQIHKDIEGKIRHHLAASIRAHSDILQAASQLYCASKAHHRRIGDAIQPFTSISKQQQAYTYQIPQGG